MLSCGKDNKILCWNPNSNQPGGEVLCELATSSQWSFEVSWCPRNPGVLATSSFDGKISVYSLMGGQQVVKFLIVTLNLNNYLLKLQRKYINLVIFLTSVRLNKFFVVVQVQPSSAIADSFPGMETLSMPVQSAQVSFY